jgi:hypothetical protein
MRVASSGAVIDKAEEVVHQIVESALRRTKPSSNSRANQYPRSEPAA